MRIRLRPMSLHELDHASGQVSVAGLLAGETATAVAPQIDAPAACGVDLTGWLAPSCRAGCGGRPRPAGGVSGGDRTRRLPSGNGDFP